MRPCDIKVGETYRNRGAGRTTRKVLAIGPEHKPYRYSNDGPPDEPGVLYEQKGKQGNLYLRSFASWAKEPA